MTDNKNINTPALWMIIAGVLLSGALWFVSTGLNGDFWYLVWVAPVPVLLLSLRSSAKNAFIISFAVYLIGRLSWFSYLERVATLVPAIILTLLLPLIFALIILLTRYVIIRRNSWYTIFAFPAFFTTYEYFVIKFSRDGTAASLAYSQMNFLPIIQIASVTGILGITFMVTFIPSAIALAWHYRDEKTKFRYITVVLGLIVGLVLLFGVVRLSNGDNEKPTVKAGIVVLNEDSHTISQHPDYEKEKMHVAAYASQVALLASQGAKLVVLPERAININKPSADTIIGILASVAKQYHVYIAVGYTNFRTTIERNSALVIDVEGNVSTDYNKVHMVVGFENEFTPGDKPGLFKFNGLQTGISICKDLDFQDYIKQYGVNKATIVCVPAWDFIVDDWLHSRMAILRGVENGFSEVRAARLGRLTISDYYGKASYEASSADKQQATLIGYVPIKRINTFYAKYGDWFGIVNLLASITFILASGNIRKVANQ